MLNPLHVSETCQVECFTKLPWDGRNDPCIRFAGRLIGVRAGIAASSASVPAGVNATNSCLCLVSFAKSNEAHTLPGGCAPAGGGQVLL